MTDFEKVVKGTRIPSDYHVYVVIGGKPREIFPYMVTYGKWLDDVTTYLVVHLENYAFRIFEDEESTPYEIILK